MIFILGSLLPGLKCCCHEEKGVVVSGSQPSSPQLCLGEGHMSWFSLFHMQDMGLHTACCSKWGCKESDTTEQLKNNNNMQGGPGAEGPGPISARTVRLLIFSFC